MAGTGAGYDLSVTSFSPDGRIFQVEYGQKAVDNGSTALAFVCSDGIIFATEKIKLSRMLVPGTNRRSYPITKTSGCCLGGMIPDGRKLVERAREEAQNYLDSYDEPIPGHVLAERVAHFVHVFTTYSFLRPFGVSILLGGYDAPGKPTLFCIEPSGFVTKYKGKAVGKGRQLASTELEKLDLDTLTCADALFHVARILHKVHDEQKPFELEVNWICKASGFQHEIVPRDLVAAAEEKAKKALEDEEED